MAQKGILQKYRVRINEDSFYQGIEFIVSQQKPEDLENKLGDLCTKIVEEHAQK